MSTQELTSLSLAEASALVASNQISPVELTNACLERIDQVDGKLNSFLALCPDQALEAARRAEQEIAAGNRRGDFHGIPYAVKDIYATAGITTTHGSKVFQHSVPDRRLHRRDEPECRRRRAGGQEPLPGVRLRQPPRGARGGAQSVEPGLLPRRFLQRLRRVRGGGADFRLHGQLHRRLHPRPRLQLQHRRPQAHLRLGQPPRRFRPQLVAGPRRPHDPHCRGLRHHAAGRRGL